MNVAVVKTFFTNLKFVQTAIQF